MPANRSVYNGNQRVRYQGWSVDVTVLAGADPSATLVAGKTSYTIFVTLISIAITTDNAATLTVQDSAGTAVVIAKTKASPGIGPIVFNFGQDGTGLTEAKDLKLAASAAGLDARVHIEGYYAQTSTLTM